MTYYHYTAADIELPKEEHLLTIEKVNVVY